LLDKLFWLAYHVFSTQKYSKIIRCNEFAVYLFVKYKVSLYFMSKKL
jgi:hypothetical protein